MKKLPYMRPVAQSLPVVYESELSYYEYLNNLYVYLKNEIVPVIEEMEQLIESEWDQMRADVDAANAGIAALNSWKSTIDSWKSTIDTWKTNISVRVENMSVSITHLNEAIEAIVSRVENIELEIENTINTALSSLNNRTTQLEARRFPHYEKSNISVSWEQVGIEYMSFTMSTTYAQLKNKEFLMQMILDSAAQYSNNYNCLLKITRGQTTKQYYLGKTTNAPSGNYRHPVLKLSFFEDLTTALCYHQFGIGTANAGIYDSIAPVGTGDTKPLDTDVITIEVDVGAYDSNNETTAQLFVHTL